MSNATTTNGKAPSQDVVAVIVGALAAMGYSADQIRSPLSGARTRTFLPLPNSFATSIAA